MEWIKKNIWILITFALFGLWVNQCNKDPEVRKVPVEVKVEVPSIEKKFDTIYEPKPVPYTVKEIDSTYYRKYVKLKDSLAKDSLFKKSIEINEYREKFKDTFQTVEVYSKTRGVLLEQTLKYLTEPRTIVVRDTIEIKPKNSLEAQLELGIPTVQGLNNTPVVKAGFVYKLKKGNGISLSYDTEGRFWAGATIKLFKNK